MSAGILVDLTYIGFGVGAEYDDDPYSDKIEVVGLSGDRWLLVYRYYGDTYVRVVTYDETNGMVVGGGTKLGDGSSSREWNLDAIALPEEDNVFVCYDDYNAGNMMTRVITVTGTTVSLGSAVNTNLALGYSTIALGANSHIVIANVAPENSDNECWAVCCSVSGSTINMGTRVEVTSGLEDRAHPPFVEYDSSQGKFILFTKEDYGTSDIYGQVLTNSGTALTVYPHTVLNDLNYPSGSVNGTLYGAYYSAADQKTILLFTNSTSGYYDVAVTAQISGTTVSFNPSVRTGRVVLGTSFAYFSPVESIYHFYVDGAFHPHFAPLHISSGTVIPDPPEIEMASGSGLQYVFPNLGWYPGSTTGCVACVEKGSFPKMYVGILGANVDPFWTNHRSQLEHL